MATRKSKEENQLPGIPQEAIMQEEMPDLPRGRHPTLPPFGTDEGSATEVPEDFFVPRELMLPGETSDELDCRTEVNALQQIHIARGRFIARRYRTAHLNHFINDLLRLGISLKRKGRKEAVQAHQSASMGDQEAAAGVWAGMKQNMRT